MSDDMTWAALGWRAWRLAKALFYFGVYTSIGVVAVHHAIAEKPMGLVTAFVAALACVLTGARMGQIALGDEP